MKVFSLVLAFILCNLQFSKSLYAIVDMPTVHGNRPSMIARLKNRFREILKITRKNDQTGDSSTGSILATDAKVKRPEDVSAPVESSNFTSIGSALLSQVTERETSGVIQVQLDGREITVPVEFKPAPIDTSTKSFIFYIDAKDKDTSISVIRTIFARLDRRLLPIQPKGYDEISVTTDNQRTTLTSMTSGLRGAKTFRGIDSAFVVTFHRGSGNSPENLQTLFRILVSDFQLQLKLN